MQVIAMQRIVFLDRSTIAPQIHLRRPSFEHELSSMSARSPNVILTPHVAWASDEAQQSLADQLMDNIERFVAGRPSNLVQGAY
jgi:lactate dehydrogenase-like 2-hydroxyacid dehydrogenase